MSNTTKKRLIVEAFKLFASKPYDQVTFADLEKVTNLSRGAILYHIKTKENLFVEVMHYFVFHTTTATAVEVKEEMTLKYFTLACIDECVKEVKCLQEIGIPNINLAKLNIESQGFYFYPTMKAECAKWSDEQYNMWEKVIEKAIINNEIRPLASPHDIASLFINQYLGISYAGIIKDNGIDLEKLRDDLLLIYSMLKK